ncbi:MAG: aldehyde dehydrogenase family protein, partial [Imperialibacter sp.]
MVTLEDTYGIVEAIEKLGIENKNAGSSTGKSWIASGGEVIESFSPADGELIASVESATAVTYEQVIKKAEEAFKSWRLVPAPQRGEVVRQIGDELRKNKEHLGKLVSYEMGKSLQEGYGEVQEMIDICDFA